MHRHREVSKAAGIRRVVAGAAALASLASATPATARDLHVERFDARIVVDADGGIEATETIRARFVGAWQGLYRTIPVEYRTPQGLNFTLWLNVVGVTDDKGAPLRFEISREQHYRKVKVFLPGAVDTTKTVMVTYRIANALRFFEDHDELYWNVTGDRWDVPIEAAAAHIVLPAGVTGLRATPFTGAFGSRAQDADLQIQPASVDVRTRQPLGFHEGLTIAVGWDKGFVHEPTWLEKVALFLRSNWPLGLPLVVLIVMTVLWVLRGRDPRLRPIAARYQPPPGLTAAEAGTLLDDSVDMRDITATLVDLAVRGFLTIEETESTSLINVFARPGYSFHLRRPVAEWAALKAHETRLLSGLFAGGSQDTVSMAELEDAFYKHIPGIKDSVLDSLMERGFYAHRPDRVRNVYLAVAIVLGVLGFPAGIIALVKLGLSPLPFFIAGAATFAVMFVFSRIMPARSERGARTLEEVLGFAEFLSQVDGDRFRQTIKTPEMFETFLPFAMAFGVEKKWVVAFDDIYLRQANWYVSRPGGQPFRANRFVVNLNQMSGRVGSALGSAPRSSGGSGFSGGSSGGGSGGGGGGGF